VIISVLVRPAALSTKAWRGDRETGPQSEARSCRNAGRPAGGTLKWQPAGQAPVVVKNLVSRRF
jgi:hypothetical protein